LKQAIVIAKTAIKYDAGYRILLPMIKTSQKCLFF